MQIVGVGVNSGSGKDTIGDHLVKQGFIKLAFANPAKDVIAQLFGWERASLDNSTFKTTVDAYWQLSPRQVLQKFGTECMRGNFGEEFWINVMKRNIDALAQRGQTKFVICDVRYPNEADAIKAWGGQLWRVDREQAGLRGSTAEHSSENAMRDYTGWDAIIDNNSSFEALFDQVDRLITE